MRDEPIIFVTSNPHKAREAASILGRPLTHEAIELDELQSMDLELIVRHKLRQAFHKLRQPVLVEDTGLFVSAWQGFPGPFIKFIQATMGYEQFGQAIAAHPQVEHVVLFSYCQREGEAVIAEGRIRGTFLGAPRGTSQFGFDPYFIPEGFHQTYAEMGAEAKNRVSARFRALATLKKMI